MSAVFVVGCLLSVGVVAADIAAAPVPQAVAATERSASAPALRLTGIFSSPAHRVLRATFAGAGAEGQSYRIGDGLPDGNTLAAIESDRVVLRRDGVDHVVRLEGFNDVMRTRAAPRASHALPQTSGAAVGATPRDLVAAIRANPGLLMDALPVEAMLERHRMIALRVGQPNDMSLMKELKLVPGDVITAINGVELNGPNQEAWMHDSAAPRHELTLKVYRDGRTETLSY
jgi:general secretion pathway protein C